MVQASGDVLADHTFLARKQALLFFGSIVGMTVWDESLGEYRNHKEIWQCRMKKH